MRKHSELVRHKTPFQRALLDWYRQNGRNLPWRRKRPVPYRVWISEIMLQQTRVAAVLGYYDRFLKRFPTINALAEAREADVLAVWSGLGYYRRARMMHAAAKQVVNDHRGKFPGSSDGLRELPGIGRYTAAAIASICFGEPAAVVDGNVERVLLRLTGRSESDPPDHWQLANALLTAEQPGDFNQAMMELGALVCLPKAPRCGECPVRKWCATRGAHLSQRPGARHAGELRYALVRRNGSIRLQQRAADSTLMAGMWELPPHTSANGRPLVTLRHSITTTDYRVSVHSALSSLSGRWIKLDSVAALPLTGLTRKILRKLELIR